MTAIQKSRKAFEDEGRAYNDETLIESSNETSTCVKVDMSMSGTPDPTGTGLFKTTTTAYNKTTKVFTCSSSAEAAKFAEGDDVILYSTTDNSKISKVKNCVKSVSGTSVEMHAPVPNIDGDIVIEKNLFFRFSNKNVYRDDSYGVPRFYSAIAGLSDIEISMGEVNEYEWNRSDYSFTVDNYDHTFDPFMPGGSHYTTFALREVNVYIGFGENFQKNKLIFSGVTNLNNGVSEEDEQLKITAYDLSYLHNIPVNLNKFSNAILDEDYRGEPIPILFGDYTVAGRAIASVQRPIIPAILYDFTYTPKKSKLVFSQGTLGISRSLMMEAKATGETYDGWQVELLYSNEEQIPSYAPTCVETALGGGKYKYTVTLYRGKRTGGKLFCSSEWIALCLRSQSRVDNNWIVNNATLEPVLYYKNLILPERDYTGEIAHTYPFWSGGGATVKKAYYKICSNGLSSNTTGYHVWYNKGSYDDQAAWETNVDKLAGSAVSPVWDTTNGELIVTMPVGFTDTDIFKYKAYVWVRGQPLSTSIKTDADLLFNYANDSGIYATIDGVNYNVQDKSGNGSRGKYIGGYSQVYNSDFSMGGGFLIFPWVEIQQGRRVKICKTFMGIDYGDCWYEDTRRYITSGTAASYSFKRSTGLNSKNFIFEMEFSNKESEYASYMGAKTIRHFNRGDKNLATFGESTGSSQNPYIRVFLSNGYVVVDYGGQYTRASSLPVDEFFSKVYGIKIVKDLSAGNKIRIFVRKITDGVAYTETSYESQPVLTDSVPALNYVIIGANKEQLDANSGSFFGEVGMVRMRMNNTSFQHENFTIYGVTQDDNDVVQISKQILKMGGATDELFDASWDNYYKSKASSQFNFREYLNDTEIKTVDRVVSLLGQVGLVLNMKEDQGKIKYGLTWDTLDYYEATGKRITSYDIELNSVNVDRELNQYFNTGNAKYNYDPVNDDFANAMVDYQEPLAVARDANLNVWFSREDKGQGSFEFPNLYIFNDVLLAMKYKIANSTPNAEKINLRLSFRFLDLKLGEFVVLNHGRYVNVPCQVRSLKIDANGSAVEVSLRSLECVQFVDAKTGQTHTPNNFDGVGGYQAIANIVQKTDAGDV